MIRNLAMTTLWSTDQARTLAFCTEKLGLEVREDVPLGEDRWLTVAVPGRPETRLAIMRTDRAGLAPQDAEALAGLVALGVLGPGALHTDDCRGDYERLRGRGVEFLQEPRERGYGVEAVFRDEDGNRYVLVQPHEGLPGTPGEAGHPSVYVDD